MLGTCESASSIRGRQQRVEHGIYLPIQCFRVGMVLCPLLFHEFSIFCLNVLVVLSSCARLTLRLTDGFGQFAPSLVDGAHVVGVVVVIVQLRVPKRCVESLFVVVAFEFKWKCQNCPRKTQEMRTRHGDCTGTWMIWSLVMDRMALLSTSFRDASVWWQCRRRIHLIRAQMRSIE